MNDYSEYCDDDGNKMNPDFAEKPSLWLTCRKDDLVSEQASMCNLTRLEQQGEDEFQCFVYEPKQS